MTARQQAARDLERRLEVLADLRECSRLGTLLDAQRKRRTDAGDALKVAVPGRRRYIG